MDSGSKVWIQQKGSFIFDKRTQNLKEKDEYFLDIGLENLISNKGVINGDTSLRTNSTSVFQKHDILFGRLRPYLNKWWYAAEAGLMSGEIWALFPINNNNSLFLYYLIQSERFLFYANISSGTRMPRASWEIIKNSTYVIPAATEQTEIGKILQALNNVITLEQEKLKIYKEIKKTLLSKLFTTSENIIPEIRFKNFNDKWIQRELKDITSITMGQSPSSKNYTDDPNDYILVQGNADLKEGRVSPRIWTTEVTKTAKPGDIILTVRAPVGDVALNDYHIVLGRGVSGLKGSHFVYQLLKRMNMINYWKKYSTGSTFESINSTDIKTAPVLVPNESEQEKIGAALKTIDNIITLEQARIEHYQNIRKNLLKNLFI